jgi:Protein of unknown function (DUF1553)/Protein of unknown function (DUF1549)/Planctomycete cytochrome C
MVALALHARREAIAQAKVPSPDFNRDVFPILADACLSCHGPDVAKRKAGLRLDTEAGLFTSRDGAAPVLRGDPIRSTIVTRTRHPDPDERMPPSDAPRQLSQAEIKTIEHWIRDGARWQGHWAYQAPVSPAVPVVIRKTWPRDPIDNFVLSRLEREGIDPATDADPHTLVRRLSLSLTGLPPSTAMVKQFVPDYRRSPDATVASAIDRLLAQTEYAEHMAAHWLAAARYADTNGYQKDDERQMWRWRDWVLQAFANNMPFDQFTVLQTAGDLVPNATVEDQIATGFHRNHRSNSEGGIIDEEYRQEYIADRVDTLASVWLGVTMSCARCHDHKYDPFTQKDYYQLAAFFSSVPERGRIVGKGNAIPTILAPTQEQSEQLESLRRAHAEAQNALADLQPAIEAGTMGWTPPAEVEQAFVRRGVIMRIENDGHPFKGSLRLGWNGAGAFSGDRAFTVAVLGNLSSNCGFEISQQDDDSDGKGWRVALSRSDLRASLANRKVDDGLRVVSAPLSVQPRHLVAVTYDGSRLASGLSSRIDGTKVSFRSELDSFVNDASSSAPIVLRALGDCGTAAGVTEIRLFDRVLSDGELDWLSEPTSLANLAKKRPLSAVQKAKLRAAWLEVSATGAPKLAWQTLIQAETTLAKFVSELPTSMVLSEGVRRPTHVLSRGAYDHPLQAVEPSVPHLWAASQPGRTPNRLDLARWLVDRNNPLTARVFVNRLWQMMFGTGLVSTSENLGVQGQRPTHPELLDHLATDFVASGWNIKQLIKRLAISRTFRQASHINDRAARLDPENRYLARAPRLRLPAEVIRDQVLAVSGLLHRQVGGASVKLPQPDGVWEDNGGPAFVAAVGPQRYRRSLYAYWKRTAPPPTLTTFDAGTRDICAVRQGTTNTPLQALALMNDPVYLESARALVERLIPKDGPAPSPEAFASEIMFRALSRPPTPKERLELIRFWKSERRRFSQDPTQARHVLGERKNESEDEQRLPERAASVLTALMVFNLDEMIVRE